MVDRLAGQGEHVDLAHRRRLVDALLEVPEELKLQVHLLLQHLRTDAINALPIRPGGKGNNADCHTKKSVSSRNTNQKSSWALGRGAAPALRHKPNF